MNAAISRTAVTKIGYSKRVKNFSIIIGVICALFAQTAFADGWSSATSYGKVLEINIQPESIVTETSVFIKADIPRNPTQCAVKTSFRLEADTERGARFYSLLMAAHAADKEVRFYVKDESCHPWNIPRVDGVYVR
jgi:hypothetical protein